MRARRLGSVGFTLVFFLPNIPYRKSLMPLCQVLLTLPDDRNTHQERLQGSLEHEGVSSQAASHKAPPVGFEPTAHALEERCSIP